MQKIPGHLLVKPTISIQNQIDYIDYINDGGYNEYYRWTNWKREPDQTEVFAGLIFKKNGQVTERLVNKVAVDFFADQETGLPTKTVLERYIGPDFDVPDDYGNLKKTSRSSI